MGNFKIKTNMKFSLLIAVATAAGTPDWTPCTKQDCSTIGWICCDVTKINNEGLNDGTGTMLCTDPTLKGLVPDSIDTYGGQTYHCTHEQHKAVVAGGTADSASNIVMSAAAVVVSAYMLA